MHSCVKGLHPSTCHVWRLLPSQQPPARRLVPLCHDVLSVSLPRPPPPPPQHEPPVLLAGPSSPDIFDNATNWVGKDIQAYFKKRVLPNLYGCFVFLGFVLGTLIFLLLWRTWGFFCGCFQSWCGGGEEEEADDGEDEAAMAKRKATLAACTDPGSVLAVGAHWWLKIFMGLFSLGAFAFCVYGLASLEKEVVRGGWFLVDTIIGFFDGVVDSFGSISRSMSLIVPALDGVSDVTTNYVRVSGFNSNITHLGKFLDTPRANVTALASNLSLLYSALPLLSFQLTTTNTDLAAVLPGLQSACKAIESYGVVSYFDNLKSKLTALDDALQGLDPTAQPAGGATDAKIVALTSLLAAISISNWVTYMTSVSAALSTLDVYISGNTLGKISTNISRLATTTNSLMGIGGSSGPLPLSALGLTTFSTDYMTSGSSALTWIVTQTAYVDSSVMALDPTTLQSVANLSAYYQLLTALFALDPKPAELAGLLSALNATIALPGSVPQLQQHITDVGGFLSTQNTNSGGTAAFQDYVSTIKTRLAELLPHFQATALALAAYVVSGSQADYSAFSASTWPDTVNTASAALTAVQGSRPTADVTSWSAMAVQVSNSMTDYLNTPAAGLRSAVTAVATAVTVLPTLATYINALQDVRASYAAFGVPTSQGALSVLSSTIAAIDTITVSNVQKVKASLAAGSGAFDDSTGRLENITSKALARLRVSYEGPTSKYGTLYYGIMCATYSVTFLFVLLAMWCALINCSLGTLVSVTLLLVVVLLFFVGAALVLALLAAAHDVCYNLESILLQAVAPQYLPLLRYYLYNVGGDSAVEPLRASGVIDINATTAAALSTTRTINDALTSRFQPRAVMLSALAGVANATATAAGAVEDITVEKLGYSSIHPMYLSLKSYLCCDAAGQLGSMWVALTFGGCCVLLMCWLALGLVYRLDKLKRLSGTWGWRGLQPRWEWRHSRMGRGRKVAPETQEGIEAELRREQQQLEQQADLTGTGEVVAAPPPQYMTYAVAPTPFPAAPTAPALYPGPSAGPTYGAVAAALAPSDPVYNAQMKLYNDSVAAFGDRRSGSPGAGGLRVNPLL